jgi:hypothetical protein
MVFAFRRSAAQAAKAILRGGIDPKQGFALAAGPSMLLIAD